MTQKQDEFNKREMALFNELWNEHDGDHFYKDEWRDYPLSFADRVREDERKQHEQEMADLAVSGCRLADERYEKGREDERNRAEEITQSISPQILDTKISKQEVLELIIKQINKARVSRSGPTSRLTELWNQVNKLK